MYLYINNSSSVKPLWILPLQNDFGLQGLIEINCMQVPMSAISIDLGLQYKILVKSKVIRPGFESWP